jgi:FHA domain/Bacterial regulatory proteins, luxR family
LVHFRDTRQLYPRQNGAIGFAPHSLSPSELEALLETERRGVPFIAHKDGAGRLCLFSLDGLEQATIGRLDHNQLALSWDPEVSRTHAQLELIGGDWMLADDGLSRNGSFVNGERVPGRRRLVDGDLLRMGKTALVFRAPRASAESTVAAGNAPLVRLTEAELRVLVALARPMVEPGAPNVPASNTEIAASLQLSLAGVKTHLRALFAKLGIEDLPQYRKRTELAQRALELGLVTQRDLRP